MVGGYLVSQPVFDDFKLLNVCSHSIDDVGIHVVARILYANGRWEKTESNFFSKMYEYYNSIIIGLRFTEAVLLTYGNQLRLAVGTKFSELSQFRSQRLRNDIQLELINEFPYMLFSDATVTQVKRIASGNFVLPVAKS